MSGNGKATNLVDSGNKMDILGICHSRTIPSRTPQINICLLCTSMNHARAFHSRFDLRTHEEKFRVSQVSQFSYKSNLRTAQILIQLGLLRSQYFSLGTRTIGIIHCIIPMDNSLGLGIITSRHCIVSKIPRFLLRIQYNMYCIYGIIPRDNCLR